MQSSRRSWAPWFQMCKQICRIQGKHSNQTLYLRMLSTGIDKIKTFLHCQQQWIFNNFFTEVHPRGTTAQRSLCWPLCVSLSFWHCRETADPGRMHFSLCTFLSAGQGGYRLQHRIRVSSRRHDTTGMISSNSKPRWIPSWWEFKVPLPTLISINCKNRFQDLKMWACLTKLAFHRFAGMHVLCWK